MRTPQQKTIKGTLYEVTPLGAKLANPVLVRLFKILGPGIANLIASPEAVSLGTASMISELSERLGDKDVEVLITTFAPTTLIQTSDMKGPGPLDPQRLDDHFAGNLGEQYLWILFCIEVNFGSFLGDLESAFRRAKGTGSPTPST